MRRIIILLCTAIAFLSHGHDWTNYILESGKEFKLWVPPATENVRGIVLVMNQMMDPIATDTNIRLACEFEDVAIISVYNTSDTSIIVKGIDQLAAESGFEEIKNAPWITIGHSAAGILAKNLAFWFPDRTAAVIQFNAVDFSKPSGISREIADIPFVAIKHLDEPTGDNWIQARDKMVNNFRAKGYRSHLISQPGGGHFGWNVFTAKLMAQFIQKSMEYQVSYTQFADNGPIALTRIAENKGYLADTTLLGNATSYAKYDNYTGDKSKAYWFFDEEHASKWYDMHKTELAKSPQTVTQVAFTCNNPWTQCSPNQKLSQASVDMQAAVNTNKPLKYLDYYNTICNTGTEVTPNAAKFDYRKKDDWVTIYQEGDATHRYAENVVRFRMEAKSSGTDQTISFNDIANKKVDDAPFAHGVSSTSNLSVDKFIPSGAIHVDGANLKIVDFAGSKSTAWIRYGQGGDGTFKTATTKEDFFEISNSRTAQSVTFNAIGDQYYMDKGIQLSASAESGNSVKYKLLKGPVTLKGDSLVFQQGGCDGLRRWQFNLKCWKEDCKV